MNYEVQKTGGKMHKKGSPRKWSEEKVVQNRLIENTIYTSIKRTTSAILPYVN
jgi:hypothetical protein